MSKCVLCGADGPGTTCASCRPSHAETPSASLTELLGAGVADEVTGAVREAVEQATTEAPPVETLMPLDGPDDATVPAPRRVFDLGGGEARGAGDWDRILDECPVFAGQDGIAPRVASDASAPAGPGNAPPTADLPAADAAPPLPQGVEQWGALLDASPVFAGQDGIAPRFPSDAGAPVRTAASAPTDAGNAPPTADLPAAGAAPPLPQGVEQWDALLDASPVFAGQDGIAPRFASDAGAPVGTAAAAPTDVGNAPPTADLPAAAVAPALPQGVEQWDALLDASPVFSGQDGIAPRFPDDAPAAPRADAAEPVVVEEVLSAGPEPVPPAPAVPEPAPAIAFEPFPGAAADLEAAPPADPGAEGPERIERWNSILDASPVFAGQGDFEVQKPASFPAGALQTGIDVRFEFDSAPADADPIVNMLVTVSPFGAPLMAGRDGPVAHVILALDVSASMNRPDKYPLLAQALAGMFHDLRRKWAHEVLVSVVAFAYGAETLVHAASSSTIDEHAVLAKLAGWEKRFTRYTDIVGALHRAGRIAYDSVRANRWMPVRIYVLTDGRPQDLAGARDVAARIAKLPVDVHGLAFGDDADVEALGQFVLGGRGGTVKHVRADTIGEAFGRIGEVAQTVVANRALLDVELRTGVTGGAAYRYRPARHRYPKNAFARGVRFSADLGTLESGRTYSLLFQLRLRRTRTQETEVGRVVLRVPGFGGPRTFEAQASIRRHPGTSTPEPDPEVQAAMDVLAALEGDDPESTLRSLRMRREIYARERRDAHVLFVIDKAILELERHGSLSALTAAEHATLVSHTLTRHVRNTGPRRGLAGPVAAGSDAASRAQPEAAEPAAGAPGPRRA